MTFLYILDGTSHFYCIYILK